MREELRLHPQYDEFGNRVRACDAFEPCAKEIELALNCDLEDCEGLDSHQRVVSELPRPSTFEQEMHVLAAR